jgi:hypothetical protein
MVQNLSNNFILLDINKNYIKDSPNIFIFYKFYLVIIFLFFKQFIFSINFYNFLYFYSSLNNIILLPKKLKKIQFIQLIFLEV